MIHILIEVACFKSSFPDVTGTGKGSKRKACRKSKAPAALVLGHKAKNFMTVIFADGALSVLYNGMQICGRRIRPAHRAGFFLLFVLTLI